MSVAVTIGIPFLNARPYLADAVRSIFAQTFTDWELILVDDGSTDGSLDIVRHINDPRVRILSDGVNRGLCARLNQIADLAVGKYLARMDADDLMHPERLLRQVEFLDRHPQIDLIDTATYTIDENNALLGIRGDCPLQCEPAAVLKSGLLIHPTVMGRTNWFRDHPYDARFFRAEDYELWMRTCHTTTFGRLPMPLFYYRESLAGNLPNYLASARTVRKILTQYGPPAVGHLMTRMLIARSHLKSFGYWTFIRLGCQRRLVQSRNRPLDSQTVKEAQMALQTIFETAVRDL